MAHPASRQAARDANASRPQGRIIFFDTLRGFTLVSMVAFHAAYDLAYLYGMDMPWFTSGPAQGIWRISISWVFIALAGWMTSLSRDNLKRGSVYAAAALVVWIATTIAAVDTSISFGILYCMAACTFVFWLLERIPHANETAAKTIAAPAAALALFALTYRVPSLRYTISGFAWLGFPGPSFSSGDYYPLVPYVFLYMAFAWLARMHTAHRAERMRENPQAPCCAQQEKTASYPTWMYRDWCPPLSALGRRSLLVYLVHQPIVLGILEAAAFLGMI